MSKRSKQEKRRERPEAVLYEEAELNVENIPYISEQSGKSQLELAQMLMMFEFQGRLGEKVKWQVKQNA